jgi:LysM repeat protein
MNTPNPLVPQGTLLEQQRSKSKSNLVIAVFTILAIHLVLFGGLLMQGCKREKAAGVGEKTNEIGAVDTSKYFANTNLPSANTNYYTETPSNNPPVTNFGPSSPAPLTTQTQTPTQEIPAATSGKTYTVVKGDTLAHIAKAQGVTLAALKSANPNVDSRKMKVGMTLQIPAGAAATAPAAPGAAETTAAEGSHTTYSVKAGDTLIKIARAHGTTPSAIKAANGMTTTKLHVGQKLKLPAPKSASVPATSPGLGSTNSGAGVTR